MKKLVIIPGGFHPFHPGHKSLYDAAVAKFPTADIYMAATDDRSERPFPFAVKKKLAQLSGVPPHRFIQVKSPFRPTEITDHYDPGTTQLIFVKSTKNARTGSDPEGPFPAEIDPKTGQLPLVTRGSRKGQPVSDYLQYFRRRGGEPMNQHAYLDYLPVQEFSGMTSGSEIRSKWTGWDAKTKAQLVNLMYPLTVGNDKLTQVAMKLIDAGLGAGVNEALTGTPIGGAIDRKTVPMANGPDQDVEEAKLLNDPKQGGHMITPDGSTSAVNVEVLVRQVARDLTSVAEMLRARDYIGVYSMLVNKYSPIHSRLKALAQYHQYRKERGDTPIKQNVDIDISHYTDYLDENENQRNR